MHGRLLHVFVTEGMRVAKGDRLAVLEAMKMMHEIIATVDGTVVRLVATPANQIAAGDLILEIAVEGESAS
jgi:geranyl-CoA carboxylase alpha subunit